MIRIKKIDQTNISELIEIYNNKYLLQSLINSIFNIPDYQIKNKSVLIKPNWVRHVKQKQEEYCLFTSSNLLLLLVEQILNKKPQKIIIGDAPIQECKLEKIVSSKFINTINEYSKSYSTPIEIRDFRRTKLIREKNKVIKEQRPLSDYIIFDLGENSFLEPISSSKSNFRVTDYNPKRLAASHRIGIHKYVITKELFNADIIISVPKLKTHQKTGITCALKNLVGINGDKDYLPHHRVGGVGFGGDCYPGKNYLRRISEYILDIANSKIGNFEYYFWAVLSKIIWHLNTNDQYHHWSAAWYGNDTCWRMVLDLNKIALFGTKHGTISNHPQRTIYTLCDGIIGGQGDGPLNPYPLPSGILSFSNDSILTDWVMTILMGFDYNKIPMVKEALKTFTLNDYEIYFNDNRVEIKDLIKYRFKTEPAPGWKGHIEYDK